MGTRLVILPMDKPHARQISAWTYENEYADYNFTQNDDTLDELMNGEYYVCLDSDDTLTGYFCFGSSARIPAVETGVYAGEALDMGLGMRPDLCGQGLGHAFVQAGMMFAQYRFAAKQLRLTVAASNKRAARTYGRLGFVPYANSMHSRSLKLFHVMVYRCAVSQRRTS